MNLLILEPPYSHLFKDLAHELKPANTYVHLFNLGYLIYLPSFRFYLIRKQIKRITPKPETIERVRTIRSLANSNIKKPDKKGILVMASYMEYLQEFITDHAISHIICHNDLRWQHAIAKEAAKEKGISIFFSEDGLFRPHTLTFDPIGVNAYSSVPRDADFYKKNHFKKVDTFKPLVHKQFKRVLRLLYFATFLILNKIGDLFNANICLKNKNYSFSLYLKLFFSKLSNANTAIQRLNINKKYIFVPLQVSSDTQTIIHSKFSGTQQVIDLVEKSYFELPSAIQNEYALVFKKHPMEAHIEYNFKDGSIVSNDKTDTLLSNCSLVVLVNSTTIVEALLKQKKVITLGESHYDIDGLTSKSNENALTEDIEKALRRSEIFNNKLVLSYLDYLKYHYQVNGNIFYYDKNTIKKLKTKFHAKK